MWAVFVVTCLIGTLGHIFIYLFENTTKSITERYHRINKFVLSESAIADNTIVIRGINQNLSCEEGNDKLKPFFRAAEEFIHHQSNDSLESAMSSLVIGHDFSLLNKSGKSIKSKTIKF